MRLSLRTRRRIIKALTWPVALLVVGWLLTQAAWRLATVEGVSAMIYGFLSGLGDIVSLIGLIWLALALGQLALSSRRQKR